MKKDDELLNQTHSYMALRRAVGWIGILLPFVLMFGLSVLFKERPVLRTISLYYHTGMRDVFVGAICAIALFLFFYRGYDKWDNLAGNLAGFFALGVALFPTAKGGPQNWAGIVHLICASFFFIILAGFSIFLFTRKGSRPTRQKRSRNRIYVICGSVMIASLVSIIVFFIFTDFVHSRSRFIFWAETIALVAFGISWLTKGGALYPDPARKPTPTTT